MFCPRCGAETEEGARYCASCGRELPRKQASSESSEGDGPSQQPSWFWRVVGTTRKQRLISAGTVAAIVVAVIAFIALEPDEKTIPQDAYNKALDANCVQHKKAIAAAQGDALAVGGLDGIGRFADALVPIAGEWRSDVSHSGPPADRRELVEDLDTALLEVQIRAGTLGRVARESSPKATVQSAEGVDLASQQVEAAIEALELERCELLTVQVGNLVQR